MEWSLVRRVAFRFGFIAAALLLFPFPLGLVPESGELVAALAKPLEWLTAWFATDVLDTGELPTEFTGSSDTTSSYVLLLVVILLATLGTAVWSVIDRRSTSHPRLAAGAVVVLRYYLALTLLTYAFAKLTQFPAPS